jgi:hypothetical protein
MKWEYICLYGGQNGPSRWYLEDNPGRIFTTSNPHSRLEPSATAVLNELGGEGWELVSVDTYIDGGRQERYVLKRPIGE